MLCHGLFEVLGNSKGKSNVSCDFLTYATLYINDSTMLVIISLLKLAKTDFINWNAHALTLYGAKLNGLLVVSKSPSGSFWYYNDKHHFFACELHFWAYSFFFFM